MRRKQSENCFTKQANFFEISGRLKNRGKTTVFDWWREFRVGSKFREFKKKNESSRYRDSTVLHWLLWTVNKRDGMKNPCLAQPEVACRLIHCRPFAHDWPLNYPPEDETCKMIVINGGVSFRVMVKVVLNLVTFCHRLIEVFHKHLTRARHDLTWSSERSV